MGISKKMLITIAVFLGILITAISVIVDLNSYSDGVKNQAQKAFNIVDKAYKENRNLTNYDFNELRSFETLRADRETKYNAGKASKKEEKDAVLLNAVGQVLDVYTQGKSERRI